MGRTLLVFAVVLPGIAGMGVFGYFALVDWEALQKAYTLFETSVQRSASLEILLARATQQNIHRINLFAEGVWFLLCAILVAVGLHGLCIAAPGSRR